LPAEDNIGAMYFFDKYSAGWTLLAFGFIALYYLVRTGLAYRRISADGAAEYDYRAGEGTLEADIDRAGYVKAYRRFYAPRRELYTGLGVLAAAALTPPAIWLFELVGTEVWKLAGRPYDSGPGPSTLVWQFMVFFVVIAFWGIVFYITAQLYHKRKPNSLRDELAKERA